MDAIVVPLSWETHFSLFSSLPSENSRHAPDDAPEAGCALFQSPGLPDQIEEFMEHHDHAVVRFGRRDLKEATIGRESQEPSFLTGHGASVLQVPFVPHDDERSWAGEFLLGLPDALDLLLYHVEACAVADAVHQDETVWPLHLPVADVTQVFSILSNIGKGFKLEYLESQTGFWFTRKDIWTYL